ncbi:hypothetical protein Tco_0117823 [Tanacetum coccineum]
MLDKTDFASWQQRIRLYCRGKENGVNILKSIDEGPFQMGTTRVIVAEGTKGSLHLGPERPRVYSDLSQDEKDRIKATVQDGQGCCSEWSGSTGTEHRVIMHGAVQLVMGRAHNRCGMLIQVKLAAWWTNNAIEDDVRATGSQDLALNEDNVGFKLMICDCLQFGRLTGSMAQTTSWKIYFADPVYDEGFLSKISDDLI